MGDETSQIKVEPENQLALVIVDHPPKTAEPELLGWNEVRIAKGMDSRKKAVATLPNC